MMLKSLKKHKELNNASFSMYQFGFVPSNDCNEWCAQMENMMGIRLSRRDVVTTFPNNEKNWYESMKSNLGLDEPFLFLGRNVVSIIPTFNRYQSCVYITIIFKEDITEDFDFLNRLRERIQENVNAFCDSFEIPFKECENESDEIKYLEYLKIQNPVLVVDNFDNTTYTSADTVCGTVYYKYEYEEQKSDRYIRVYKQVYILNDGVVKKESIDHFHSIFILFHRSYVYYMELKKQDSIRNVIFKMSDAFNRIWPSERMHFFMMNKVWHASLYNKTFLTILELTAQIDTIINQLTLTNRMLSDKYSKQYERVLHNFMLSTLEKTHMYDELMGFLTAPAKLRNQSIDKIRSLYEPTDEQISRLRSDNDSRVNFTIQSIMSILTIVFFIWGVLSVWYQTTINFSSPLTDSVLFNSHYWPATFTLIAGFTGVFSIVTAFFISGKNSTSYCKAVKSVIKNKDIDCCDIDKILSGIKECKKTNKRLLAISQIFSVFTSYIILNDSNQEIDQKKYTKMIETMEQIDVCREREL